MKTVALLLLLALCAFTQAPKQSPGVAVTTGTCSPANTGNGNTFTITCGIGKQQGEKMLAILNKILADQLDPAAVMEKLNDIQQNVREMRDAAADRAISAADAQRMIPLLTPFRGQKVDLTFVSADNETGRLAGRIQAILKTAEWNVPAQLSGSMFFANGPLFGIEVTTRETSPAALAILSALRLVLPDVQGHLQPQRKDDSITVNVFSRH